MEEEKLIRLNKYLAHAGIGNRRECDTFITEGLVTVNDTLINKTGTKINMNDTVTYRGEVIEAEKKVYVLLNKPKNISSFKTNEEELKSIYYLTHAFAEKLQFGYTPKIKPIDILDIDERGLILLTNDGALEKKLSKNPKIERIYHLILDKGLAEEDYDKIIKGFKVESGSFKVKEMGFLKEDNFIDIGIKVQLANNKILIDIFETLGYKIDYIDRTVYSGLNKRDLPRGRWRFLKPEEVIKLKY
ncbi:MAG: 23S rRNA pseudouridine2605 synthase [Planctomycetota bacterium]|jgi:23S rRNA pseudouridine2605 synthase